MLRREFLRLLGIAPCLAGLMYRRREVRLFLSHEGDVVAEGIATPYLFAGEDY